MLTAFVVETYTLLLPDSSSTTNQLLAHGFSSQFATNPVPSAFNSTFSSLLTSSNFTPPTSARWINALFFLSLVHSLAAAFFGILAKQWLREYMQWNSPLGEPRENVLVRQARFEAWESWNVAATISSVPALLELAMVLFLIGVVILLWTIDDVVAIVLTVAIAAFLSLAVTCTILPVFMKHCPYKSPLAWACVATVRSISQPLPSVYHKFYNRICILFFKLFGSYPSIDAAWDASLSQQQFAELRHRRDRDLLGTYALTSKIGGRWSKSLDLRKAVRVEMLAERRPFVTQSVASDFPHFLNDNPDLEQEIQVLRDIGHTTLLLRALSWVRVASQDVRVQGYVQEAADSIRRQPVVRDALMVPADLSDKAQDEFLRQLRGQAMANWCIVTSFISTLLKQPYAALLPSFGPMAGLPSRFMLRRAKPSSSAYVARFRELLRDRAPELTPSNRVLWRWATWNTSGWGKQGAYAWEASFLTLSEDATPCLPLICHIVCAQLKDAVTVLEAISPPKTKRQPQELTTSYLVQQISDLYSLLFILTAPSQQWQGRSSACSFLVDVSCLILCNKHIKHVIDMFCPRLRTRIIASMFAITCARVEIDSSGALGLYIIILLNIDGSLVCHFL